MTIDTKHFKELLTQECGVLEEELKTVGRKNPDDASDWEATKVSSDDEIEEGDIAENIEQYENNSAVLEQLETRLHEVRKAMEKIEAGTYGICEICNETIEEDRLKANPAATTCKQHMNG